MTHHLISQVSYYKNNKRQVLPRMWIKQILCAQYEGNINCYSHCGKEASQKSWKITTIWCIAVKLPNNYSRKTKSAENIHFLDYYSIINNKKCRHSNYLPTDEHTQKIWHSHCWMPLSNKKDKNLPFATTHRTRDHC